MSDHLDDIKARHFRYTEMLEELREVHTMTASMVFRDGVWCDECGYGDCVAQLLATAIADLAELVAFAELVLEELKKHWFNGEQKTVDECSHCGGTARDEPCWAAELQEKLETL